jgi:hypothetical protein
MCAWESTFAAKFKSDSTDVATVMPRDWLRALSYCQRLTASQFGNRRHNRMQSTLQTRSIIIAVIVFTFGI